MIKYAYPQCWQCKKYQPGYGNTTDGFCFEAAAELKHLGYPISVETIPVHGRGDATNCGGEFKITPKALAELLADDFTVTYAPAEIWAEMRAMQGQDDDAMSCGDPHEGMTSQPRDAAEWAGRQSS